MVNRSNSSMKKARDKSKPKKVNIFIRAFKEKKLHKKWWFWLIVVGVIVLALIGSSQGYKDYIRDKKQNISFQNSNDQDETEDDDDQQKAEEKERKRQEKEEQKRQKAEEKRRKAEEKQNNKNSQDNTVSTDSSSNTDCLRKCTVMEAADLYNTKSVKAGKNVFNVARDTCIQQQANLGDADFNSAVLADWENRKNEQIEGHNLEYYLSILGW